MPKITIQFLLFIALSYCINCTSPTEDVPEFLFGTFEDDYKIEYELNEKVFFQKPSTRFHIIKWNVDEQYFIAKNDSTNPYDPSLYSRIDWMKLENMPPFKWGFCLSMYNASSADSAEVVNTADRSLPKTGCNGYPFSRMKPITK